MLAFPPAVVSGLTCNTQIHGREKEERRKEMLIFPSRFCHACWISILSGRDSGSFFIFFWQGAGGGRMAGSRERLPRKSGRGGSALAATNLDKTVNSGIPEQQERYLESAPITTSCTSSSFPTTRPPCCGALRLLLLLGFLVLLVVLDVNLLRVLLLLVFFVAVGLVINSVVYLRGSSD